jgi:4'-phosphopantetheinyl transferase EntD
MLLTHRELLTPAELLAPLLPAGVVLQTARIDAAIPLPWPEEQAAVARAVPSRQHEFAAGRHCARQALQQLGLGAQDIPAITAGADRAPRWPVGTVGSITHDDDWAAAAVAWRHQVAGLGIDIDVLARFTPELEQPLCAAGEREAWLIGQPAALRQRRLALLFCIKEAVYKAQHPLTGAWLDFADLRVELPDAVVGDFSATLLRAAGPWSAGHPFRGRCASGPQRCAAALVLTPDQV